MRAHFVFWSSSFGTKQKERAIKDGLFFTQAGRSSLEQVVKERLSLPKMIFEG